MTSEEEMRINVIMATQLMIGIDRFVTESVDRCTLAVVADHFGGALSIADVALSQRHIQHERELSSVTLFLLKLARQYLGNAQDDEFDLCRGVIPVDAGNWRVHLQMAENLMSNAAVYFCMDMLPGKQLAIDADLNFGVITEQEASERRDTLRFQANLLRTIESLVRALVVFPQDLSPMYRNQPTDHCSSNPGRKCDNYSKRKRRHIHDRSSS